MVLFPLESVAVSVNVVVAVTFADVLPVVTGVTEPTLWSMERLVAPVTFQASVTEPPPAGRLVGVAVKLLMVGPLPPPPPPPPLEQPANAKTPSKAPTKRLVMTIGIFSLGFPSASRVAGVGRSGKATTPTPHDHSTFGQLFLGCSCGV
jgi:hypothetical protein